MAAAKLKLPIIVYVLAHCGSTIDESSCSSPACACSFEFDAQDRGDGWLDSKLYMRQALPTSFRTYALVAENSVAVTTHQLQLKPSQSKNVN